MAAEARDILGDTTKFSQGLLSPVSFGPKPTLDQIQRLVDKVLKVAKNVIPVSVIGNPGQIAGVQVPAGAKPKGALINGYIYLFADNISSAQDAREVIAHHDDIQYLGLNGPHQISSYELIESIQTLSFRGRHSRSFP
jgi:hypothetical protein